NLEKGTIDGYFSSPIIAAPENNPSVFVNELMRPRWSPDGKWIAFMAAREDPSGMGLVYFGPYIVDITCIQNNTCGKTARTAGDFKAQRDMAAVSWTSDNRMAVALKNERDISFFNPETLELDGQIALPDDHNWYIEGMEFSPDGNWISIKDGNIFLYDIHRAAISTIIHKESDSHFWIVF
ncbi:MAG: hypothetical protein ACK2UB_06875, partial [Anaerolineales bacterium]